MCVSIACPNPCFGTLKDNSSKVSLIQQSVHYKAVALPQDYILSIEMQMSNLQTSSSAQRMLDLDTGRKVIVSCTQGPLMIVGRTRHGRFAVVRIDLQRGMHPHCKALLSGVEGLLGGVTSSVANDKNVVAEQIHSVADEHDVLVPVHELHKVIAILFRIKFAAYRRAQPSHKARR